MFGCASQHGVADIAASILSEPVIGIGQAAAYGGNKTRADSQTDERQFL